MRIFANAGVHKTPCWSSSALHYATELDVLNPEHIARIQTCGGGTPKHYPVHRIEPIVRLM